MKKINRNTADEDGLNCLVIGTENQQIYIVECEAFTVLSTVTKKNKRKVKRKYFCFFSFSCNVLQRPVSLTRPVFTALNIKSWRLVETATFIRSEGNSSRRRKTKENFSVFFSSLEEVINLEMRFT